MPSSGIIKFSVRSALYADINGSGAALLQSMSHKTNASKPKNVKQLEQEKIDFVSALHESI